MQRRWRRRAGAGVVGGAGTGPSGERHPARAVWWPQDDQAGQPGRRVEPVNRRRPTDVGEHRRGLPRPGPVAGSRHRQQPDVAAPPRRRQPAARSRGARPERRPRSRWLEAARRSDACDAGTVPTTMAHMGKASSSNTGRAPHEAVHLGRARTPKHRAPALSHRRRPSAAEIKTPVQQAGSASRCRRRPSPGPQQQGDDHGRPATGERFRRARPAAPGRRRHAVAGPATPSRHVRTAMISAHDATGRQGRGSRPEGGVTRCRDQPDGETARGGEETAAQGRRPRRGGCVDHGRPAATALGQGPTHAGRTTPPGRRLEGGSGDGEGGKTRPCQSQGPRAIGSTGSAAAAEAGHPTPTPTRPPAVAPVPGLGSAPTAVDGRRSSHAAASAARTDPTRSAVETSRRGSAAPPPYGATDGLQGRRHLPHRPRPGRPDLRRQRPGRRNRAVPATLPLGAEADGRGPSPQSILGQGWSGLAGPAADPVRWVCQRRSVLGRLAPPVHGAHGVEEPLRRMGAGGGPVRTRP